MTGTKQGKKDQEGKIVEKELDEMEKRYEENARGREIEWSREH